MSKTRRFAVVPRVTARRQRCNSLGPRAWFATSLLLVFTPLLPALLGAERASAGAPHVIHLEPAAPGRVFEGIGAVSAGASSRLLRDYPAPQRSQILDFLFRPKFGAGFQHLKVEIGGGENSTCGSEPSHVLTREELTDPKPRGYEFWLMAEARKRNPRILLDGLPWCFPAWVGRPFSQESADWFAAFLETARNDYGLELDWISAAQNELGTDLSWIRGTLRPTLDARGFANVKLQTPDDDSEFWQIFDTLEQDPELDRLIGAVGYHYVDGRNPWEIDQHGGRDATEKAKRSGKPLWASEEWSQSGKEWGGKGALYLARLINKLYIRDRITKYQIWCPIDSIYDQIIWSDTGTMQADTPWCGHYAVWPAVWAVAHTTQFAEPGWRYLDGACGQIDPQTWRGSYVALCDPASGEWSAIIVTGERRTIRLTVATPLKQGPVHVWKSTASAQFEELAPLTPRDGTVELDLEADAVYTFTSTTGQQKGSYGPPPARRPFPFPYEETFENYQPGDTPRYFADQKGTFEVSRRPDGGSCLAQVVPEEGILWTHAGRLPKPHTLFGDSNWQDCAVEADVLLTEGDVEIGGRYATRNKLGYRWILARDGRWQLNWQENPLGAGALSGFDAAVWHHLRLELDGDQIRGLIDGRRLASVTDRSRAKGMAFLASTYARNLFDNVRVTPLAAAHGFAWPSAVPADCPFPRSPTLTGIYFTGRHRVYPAGDTWYPSWASDGNLYSPWTDGVLDGMGTASGAGTNSNTGHAVMIGDDPLHLEIHNTSRPKVASALPYRGRYPCGSLVHDGVWFYGTYCLGPASRTLHHGIRWNWPNLGPFPGFQISRDYGKTWEPSPLTPDHPLFPEPAKFLGPVKMGAPHFVDFGKNMEHSPDGNAYLLGMGAEENDPQPRPCLKPGTQGGVFEPNPDCTNDFAHANLSWITADQVYLARVKPSPATMNDLKAYEFFAGYDTRGQPVWSATFADLKSLLEWNNHMGCVTATWVPGLRKHLMCVTDGWPTMVKMTSYILEADVLTGPWRMVTYLRDFGEQGYFLNFPSKFISADGKTLWLCYSANFSGGRNGEVLKFNPPGEPGFLRLYEVVLLGPGESKLPADNAQQELKHPEPIP